MKLFTMHKKVCEWFADNITYFVPLHLFMSVSDIYNQCFFFGTLRFINLL